MFCDVSVCGRRKSYIAHPLFCNIRDYHNCNFSFLLLKSSDESGCPHQFSICFRRRNLYFNFSFNFHYEYLFKVVRGQLVFSIFVGKWSFDILFFKQQKGETPGPICCCVLDKININTSASGYLLRSTSLTTLNSLRVISFEDQKS